jgi:hypothetical protein
MAIGERIDWGGDASQGRRLSKSSFSGLLGRDKSPRGAKNNNKYTGFTVKSGGSAGQKTAAGLSGLHVTKVDRKVNLLNTRRNQTVTSGGGHPSRAIVQAKPASVRVRPEK